MKNSNTQAASSYKPGIAKEVDCTVKSADSVQGSLSNFLEACVRQTIITYNNSFEVLDFKVKICTCFNGHKSNFYKLCHLNPAKFRMYFILKAKFGS